MAGRALLSEINAAIHDEWFDVERIAHDAERAEMRLAFYRGRRTGRILKVERAPLADDVPEPFGELIVRGVVDIHVEDDADVGWYTVERLEFDQDAGKLTLRSNIPLVIVVEVRSLDVEFVNAPPSA
jgi:hypothetical protein